MESLIVLVDLKDGVSPDDYERWVTDFYAPAARSLSSVAGWRNDRVVGLLGSDDAPPYRYVVTVEVSDPRRLAEDMSSTEMQGLLEELHGYADVTQLAVERFV